MNLYLIKAVGWDVAIYVTASSTETALASWSRFRRSEVIAIERVATSQAEESVFVACGEKLSTQFPRPGASEFKG